MPKTTRQTFDAQTAAVPRGAPGILADGLYRAWCATCIGALIFLIGARWLRYSGWSETPAVNGFLRETMVIEAQTFLWAWVYTNVKARLFVLALAIVAVSLHRRLRAQLVVQANGVWRLRRLPVALLLAAMLWLQYGFDINPTLGWVAGTSIAFFWIVERPEVAVRLPPAARIAAGALLLAGCLWSAHDVVDRLAIGCWAVFLLATHWQRAQLAAAHLVLLRCAMVIPLNVLSAAMPLYLPLHGGRHVGDGLAYCFCEVPGRDVVYATVPVCDSVRNNYEECRESRVVEYDRRTMKPVATHEFLSPDFHGRLELMVCLADEVQISVQGTKYKGQDLVQSAMSFPVDAPERFTPVVAGAGVGNSIAYDETHDAIWYTGEFNHAVVRYDRRTKQFDDRPSRHFQQLWYHPFSLEQFTGSLTLYTNSIHPGRNRIYMAEWLHGRYAHAIDLTTLEPVARYDVAGGGAMGITVDPERDRLFVSSLWGLEVFDLATGRLLLRKRTGLGNRPVIVDPARNQLYLSSMVEGKIRIFDRDTLALIGQVPIGIGSRYAYLSRDGELFLASSTTAHYAWDADTLARPKAAAAASAAQ